MLTTDGHGKIRVLPEDVVNRIAAGEVVERPAAVVKELLENSVDAGSHLIVCDIQDGGLSVIRVTDDGEGMSPEDAPRAFHRHATSKLRSDVDLWSIRSMGFRGEALPSIAAVSTVRLTTAVPSAGAGITFEVNGGMLGPLNPAPPVTGTRIEVADLFYNQPARKKFLKSVATEFSHIGRVVQQAALAWPSIHFRLTHNGVDIFNYPSVQSEADRISQVYPRAFVPQSLAVKARLPGATLSGLIIDPVHAKSIRVPQDLFVNRRPVRHAGVFHAVGEGYGSFLAKGCHPRFVLFLDVDPDRVDVNVHPAKREVRFADTETIHQLVRRSVRQVLSGRSVSEVVQEISFQPVSRDPVPAVEPAQPSREQVESASPSSLTTESEPQLPLISETAEPYHRIPSAEVRALGQINRTFLVVQLGGDLTVIDQHTAHERVLFERLYRAWKVHRIQVQPLLLPETLELAPPQAALLERYRGDLEQLGIEIEPFGASTVLIRSVPLGLRSVDPGPLVQDLLDDLLQWDRVSTIDDRARSVLASLACHGAVRAGRSMQLEEITALVEEWRAEGEITTCPHGRRTSFRLSTDDLEKMFGRAGWS